MTIDEFHSLFSDRSDLVCWEWPFQRVGGYGRVRMSKPTGIQTRLAHRVAYLLVHGDPGNLLICHHCDNPPCCNPKHLFAGTVQDNADDMVRKRRFSRHPAKITEEMARTIRDIKRQTGAANIEIGGLYGLSKSEISNILNGHNWHHGAV